MKIPLIEPYFAASTTGVDGEWRINCRNRGIPILSLTVVDSIILGYNYDPSIADIYRRDSSWYIIVPATGDELQYDSFADFSRVSDSLIGGKANLRDVRVLFNEYARQGYLNWFPEELRR